MRRKRKWNYLTDHIDDENIRRKAARVTTYDVFIVFSFFTMNNKQLLTSDNISPMHPQIVQAIIYANTTVDMPYGNDRYTKQAIKDLCGAFEREVDVLFLTTWTAANVIAIDTVRMPHTSIMCSDVSHIATMEAAAPEYTLWAKLHTVISRDGKIDVAACEKKYETIAAKWMHASQPSALSLTQPTELGTVYTIDEIRPLVARAKSKQMRVHIDGARLPLVKAALWCSYDEMSFALWVDAVSFGITKTGWGWCDMVVLPCDRDFTPDLAVYQKPHLQLQSKLKYTSVQCGAFFVDELGDKLAEKMLVNTKKLAEQFRAMSDVEIVYPVETNHIFVRGDERLLHKLVEEHGCYRMGNVVRVVCGWDVDVQKIIL